MLALSAAVSRTALAATFAMAAKARALRAAGHDVISLSLGEPDFPTPDHVVEAAAAAARRGETKYPPLSGTEALKAAVRRKYAREQRLEVAEQDILVTNGGKQAIFNMVASLIDPGDEVIIPAPAWAGYEQTVQFAGGRAVFIPCPQAAGFVLQPAALAAAITPRSRLLLLNYPNNPSGAACSAGALRGIADVLRRHPQVAVLADDIYEHLLFDDFRYATLAAVAPDLAERIVTMTGVSKSYAMTGWRLGLRRAAPADPGDDGGAGHHHLRGLLHRPGCRRGGAAGAAGHAGHPGRRLPGPGATWWLPRLIRRLAWPATGRTGRFMFSPALPAVLARPRRPAG